MSAVHLAIMHEPYLSLLFDGKKLIESRFSKNRIAPYQRIAKGDTVFVAKHGFIRGFYTVENVEFRHLKPGEIDVIRKDFNDKICADSTFWEQKADAKYATLISISDVIPIEPLRIDKNDRRAWVIEG